MATLYVVPDASGASDANDGTAATTGGGHGPWLTLAHAAATHGSGDTIYVEGGVTFREVVTLATANGTWIADLDGSHTNFAGQTVWSAFLTNDTTAPSASPIVTINAKNGHAFTGFKFIGGTSSNGSCFYGSAAVSGPTFTNCEFIGNGSAGPLISVNASSSANGLKIDRCSLIGTSNNVNLVLYTMAQSAGSDYDGGFRALNSVFVYLTSGSGNIAINLSSTGASGKPGGGLVYGCSIFTGGIGVDNSSNNISGQYPCLILGNYFYGANTGIRSNTRCSQAEDWNIFEVVTSRTNTGTGPNSISRGTYAPSFEVLHAWHVKSRPRPFSQPSKGSPLLGFMPSTEQIVTGITATTVDDSTVGTIAWTNPNNAQNADGTAATNVLTTSATGHYLKATNMGFALPSTATVTQIRVEYSAAQTGSGQAAGNSIKLCKTGTISGNDNSAQMTNLTASATVYSVINGSGDLWGLTWLYSDINNSGFGVAISFKNTSGASSVTPSLDYIRIVVSYTDSAGISDQTRDFMTGPRPSGQGSAGTAGNIAIGAFERSSGGIKDSSTYNNAPPSARLDGPDFIDIDVGVDTTTTQLTVYTRYNSSYAGTLPSMSIVSGAECGVADGQSATSVQAANTWAQLVLTLAASPTAAGAIIVRLRSATTAAAGSAWFDDWFAS